MDVSEPDNMKTSNNKFNYFDLHYPKAIRTIKSLEDFITNRIISNISMSREYNYPSLDRQNVLTLSLFSVNYILFFLEILFSEFAWIILLVFDESISKERRV